MIDGGDGGPAGRGGGEDDGLTALEARVADATRATAKHLRHCHSPHLEARHARLFRRCWQAATDLLDEDAAAPAAAAAAAAAGRPPRRLPARLRHLVDKDRARARAAFAWLRDGAQLDQLAELKRARVAVLDFPFPTDTPAGADHCPLLPDSATGWTLLHVACWGWLRPLASGARVHAGDPSTTLLKFLLGDAVGADPFAVDVLGRTPLHVAAARHWEQGCRILVAAMGGPGQVLGQRAPRDLRGWTPQMYAKGCCSDVLDRRLGKATRSSFWDKTTATREAVLMPSEPPTPGTSVSAGSGRGGGGGGGGAAAAAAAAVVAAVGSAAESKTPDAHATSSPLKRDGSHRASTPSDFSPKDVLSRLRGIRPRRAFAPSPLGPGPSRRAGSPAPLRRVPASPSARVPAPPPFGACWAFGARNGGRDRYEDAHVCGADVAVGGVAGLLKVFAIFDGHGGDYAARFCEARLVGALERRLRDVRVAADVGRVAAVAPRALVEALEGCMVDLDAELRQDPAVAVPGDDNKKGGYDRSGCTALVSVVSPTHIVTANAGDCRGVLRRRVEVPGAGSKSTTTIRRGVVPLSRDFAIKAMRAEKQAAAAEEEEEEKGAAVAAEEEKRPELNAKTSASPAPGAPDAAAKSRPPFRCRLDAESWRVKRAGGKVLSNGRVKHRCWVDDALEPTRGLGDFLFKPPGDPRTVAGVVTCVPEVSVVARATAGGGDVRPASLDVLILGCDGVWDQFCEGGSAEACDIVVAQAAAAASTRQFVEGGCAALLRVVEQRAGSHRDNVSAMVVALDAVARQGAAAAAAGGEAGATGDGEEIQFFDRANTANLQAWKLNPEAESLALLESGVFDEDLRDELPPQDAQTPAHASKTAPAAAVTAARPQILGLRAEDATAAAVAMIVVATFGFAFAAAAAAADAVQAERPSWQDEVVHDHKVSAWLVLLVLGLGVLAFPYVQE